LKYAIFTYYGYGLPIAKRLADEGYEVIVAQVEDYEAIRSPIQGPGEPPTEEVRGRRLSLYDGILEKQPAEKITAKLQREKTPEDWFLFFDLNHLFRFAAELAGRGFRGNFPTEKDFCYEIDRDGAKDFVDKEYEMVRVGDKKRFSSIPEARKFLESSEELWVLKGQAEDAQTVVPDTEDIELARNRLLDALAARKTEYESAEFILELFIRDAMELTPAKVYYNGEPVYTSMCIENKPIGSGNIGPMTDCAQDIVFRTELEDRINKIAFPPIVDEMAAQREGLFYWDASLYLDPRTGRPYFGEFCANRPGYSSLYSEIALCGSASRYFESVVAGKNPHPENQVGASVRVFNLHTDDSGMPQAGRSIQYKEQIENDLWLWDVRSEKGRLETCGYADAAGVVTGRGHSLNEAVRHAYRSIDTFSMEGSYYRPDFDFLSRDYKSSIPNRLNLGLQRGFYKIGFAVD
jgi:phosphoribosylamine-glycine ligase